MMERELVANGVDVSGSGRTAMPSGQGLVLLQPGGAATSIVLWGANTAFAKVGWGRAHLGGGAHLHGLYWSAVVAVRA